MFFSRFFKNTAKPGFSLPETMMQLMILTTITVPMVMMVNIQKQGITESRADTTNQIMTNELFDNVSIQHPDPINAYAVLANTSIYCDPATRVKDATTYTNMCTGLPGPGKDISKGPFFQRTLAYSPNYQTLSVTVNLYKAIGDLPANAYFTLTRQYNLDSYHVFNKMVTDGTLTATGTANNFDENTLTDNAGNLWYPSYTSTLIAPSSVGGDKTYYVAPNGGCALTNTGGTGLGVPFNGYETLASDTCANGASHVFKVMPDKDYDVKLYFILPAAPAYNCMSNTGTPTGSVSCSLADVDILSRDTAYADTPFPTLKSYRNFDISAASSMGNTLQRVVLSTTVTTPADAAELEVLVKPTTPDTNVTTVSLAGIEVTRRPDK